MSFEKGRNKHPIKKSLMSLFLREHESGHSMPILDWVVAVAVLYSLCVSVLVWAQARMAVSLWYGAMLVPTDLDATAWISKLQKRVWYSFLQSLFGSIYVIFMYSFTSHWRWRLWIPATLCCTSLPHSSVTHSVAPSLSSAQQEVPAGPH